MGALGSRCDRPAAAAFLGAEAVATEEVVHERTHVDESAARAPVGVGVRQPGPAWGVRRGGVTVVELRLPVAGVEERKVGRSDVEAHVLDPAGAPVNAEVDESSARTPVEVALDALAGLTLGGGAAR